VTEAQVTNKIKQIYRDSNKANCWAKYQIGELINSQLANAPRRYGTQLIARLGSKLMVSSEYLYSMSRVAKRWTPTEFKALLARYTHANKTGLSWTHYFYVIAVPDKAQRAVLLDVADARGLTAGQFHEVVAEHLANRSKISEADLNAMALTRLTDACELKVNELFDHVDAMSRGTKIPKKHADVIHDVHAKMNELTKLVRSGSQKLKQLQPA